MKSIIVKVESRSYDGKTLKNERLNCVDAMGFKVTVPVDKVSKHEKLAWRDEDGIGIIVGSFIKVSFDKKCQAHYVSLVERNSVYTHKEWRSVVYDEHSY